MQVVFYKTGERRYAIKILRDDFADLEMNPAPGFDELMPHDMCHLIVEEVLEIKNGIYGQIAQNGTAGSFRSLPADKNSKQASRQRRKTRQKGKKLAKKNLDDLAKSERATYVCWQNWLAHSDNPKLKAHGQEMKPHAENILRQMAADERAIYTKKVFDKVRARMDKLSGQWQNLKIGETLIIDW